MRKLTHKEIVSRQNKASKRSKIKLVAVLNDIRSLYNVGSIFRTADAVGLEKLWLCGITGYPPNSRILKTALGAVDSVDWEYNKDIVSVIKNYKKKGYRICLLEQAQGSIPHDEFICTGPVCLVIGNEIGGVAEQLITLCDDVIEIEMSGIKNSLNVSVAFGIAAYQIKSSLKKNKSR